MRKRALSMAIAAVAASAPALTTIPSASAASCTTQSLFMIVLRKAPVHANYYGSARILGYYTPGSSIFVTKSCINNYGNLWFYTVGPGQPGWIYGPYLIVDDGT